MSVENRTVGMSRRTFLGLGTRVVAGVVAGEVGLQAGYVLNAATEKTTGHPAGNAGVRKRYEETCPDNAQTCDTKSTYSTKDTIGNILVYPPFEEIIFRTIPSGFLSTLQNREKPAEEMLTGSREKWTLTRSELLTGLGLSLLVGLRHNMTGEREFDTRTIPSAQVFSAMTYWYLQRKFGILGNTTAHMWNNFRWHGKY